LNSKFIFIDIEYWYQIEEMSEFTKFKFVRNSAFTHRFLKYKIASPDNLLSFGQDEL